MNNKPQAAPPADKAQVLQRSREYLFPHRIATLASLGVDLVIGQRAGYRFWDLDGREYMDFHLNGGTYSLGHRNPRLLATLRESLEYADIGNHHFTNPPRAELAERLAQATGLQYSVFTPSGAEANDVAIKSARRFTGRRKIVALEQGYHGRSGLSGAAGDDKTAAWFGSDYPEEFIKVPFNDVEAMERALAGDDVAAVLMETIPATSGFPLPEPGYLPAVKALCERHGTVYVADEVQTGLGRTGKLWGVECWDVQPDILITGKCLSGGLYPVSAAVLSRELGTWLAEDGWGYVSTYGGAEPGCAVGCTALQMCADPATLANVETIAEYIGRGLRDIQSRHPFLLEVRQQGLVMGLRFDAPDGGARMTGALYKHGLWAMFAGFDPSVLQFKPGLLVDTHYCDEALQRVEDALADLIRGASGRSLMNAAEFEALPRQRQLQLLTELGTAALSRWGLDDARLELLKHRENTVMQVTAPGGERYAMRIHRIGYRSDAELLSELQWLDSLREAGIPTTEPLRAGDGSLFATVTTEGLPEGRQVDLLEWVPGRAIGSIEEGVDLAAAELIAVYRAAGALAARIHNHGQHWQRPPGFTRLSWDEQGFFGPTDSVCGCYRDLPDLSPSQLALLDRARDATASALAEFGKASDRWGLVHGDFLPENLFYDGSELRLIDWDDTGFGWHLYDFTTALVPHLGRDSFDPVLAAMVEGYRNHRPLPDEHLEILPFLLMARALSYVGWAHTRRQTAGDMVPVVIAISCELAQRLLASA